MVVLGGGRFLMSKVVPTPVALTDVTDVYRPPIIVNLRTVCQVEKIRQRESWHLPLLHIA